MNDVAVGVDGAGFRSEARRRSARENGRKSRGPLTEAGKAASCRNALKHGLSSATPVVLPPDLTAELAAEVELFSRDLKPQNHVEQRLVETAALSCVRFLRLSHAEVNMAQGRARSAVTNWRIERRGRVRELVGALDGARGGMCAETLFALKQSSLGCRVLSRRYGRMAAQLANGGSWTMRDVEQLARLEGFRGTLPEAADSEARKTLWRRLCSLLNESEPDVVAVIGARGFGLDAEAFEASLPDAEEARGKVVRWLLGRSRTLRARACRLWEANDLPERDEAPGRALFDGSNEGKLLARYMNDAQRTMRLAIREIQRVRVERDRAVERAAQVGAREDGSRSVPMDLGVVRDATPHPTLRLQGDSSTRKGGGEEDSRAVGVDDGVTKDAGPHPTLPRMGDGEEGRPVGRAGGVDARGPAG